MPPLALVWAARPVDAGGMGTAAALTLHRAVEGAALALTASVVVIIALVVHSASEGLALAALLDIAKQRLLPWLVVACLSPAVGVAIATFSPLPDHLVPILLAMVMGVLCRTAVVGMKLAASKQQGGRLSRRHIAIAATTAAGAGLLLATAHSLGEQEEPPHLLTAPRDAAGMADTAAQVTERRAAPPPLSRDELSHAVRSGRLSLAEVFRRTDPVTQHTPIRRILRALPGATPATVRDLITSTGVGAKEHIADLSDRQRRILLTALTHRPELVTATHTEDGD